MNNLNLPNNPVSHCRHVNILSSNDKLHNRQFCFCDYIAFCQRDVACFSWKYDTQKPIHLTSYAVHNFARKVRHKNAKRYFRGMAILIANWLNKHIKIKRVNEYL